MRWNRRWMLLAALAVWLAACGGGGGAETTVTTGTGPTSTTAATSTTIAGTTSTAPTTTTTTTTASTSTEVPADVHPAWPVSWTDLWPADGSTATVRAESYEGTIDAEVGMNYGVEWDGGVWDQIWLGSPETGFLGVSFYLQRPEPWVVVLWGAHTYGPTGFDMTERFDPPLTLDLRGLPDGEISEECTLMISDSNGGIDEGPYTLTLSFVGFETVEVAAGTFTDTAHLHLVAEEPGGFVAETDLWIDGEQALVRLAPAHIWTSLELVEPWSG